MLNQAEYFVKTEAKDVPEIQTSIDAIAHYITDGNYHKSKERRLEQWGCYEGDLFELVISVFTICLQGQQTYQSLVGLLAGKIPMKNKLDRLQTMAEVIAIISITGLIRVTKTPGQTIIIDTEYTLENIPTLDKHEIIHQAPKHITKNYTDEEGSMLLGSSFNYHTDDICLDHINKMNAVELKLNIPFLCKVEEEPKKMITDHDQQIQWDHFVKDSRSTYLGVGERTFHLAHKDDARGRTYAVGYHINYQGSSFKKAIVQLANSEVLREF